MTPGGTPCQFCQGSAQVPSEFPFPYHEPFNLTVSQPIIGTGVTVAVASPQQQVPGSPGNPNQTGVNPVTLKLGNEGAFDWLYVLLHASSPTVVGDASRFIQLALSDLSGTNWPFQAAPIMGDLYGGNAQLVFSILRQLTFGINTQLSLQAYLVNYLANKLDFGVGTGAAATFTGILNGPVLPGSVSVTVYTAGVAGITTWDNGQGAFVNNSANVTGTINYTTGAISVTYAADPAAATIIEAAYTQGCAQVDLQLDLWGSYLRPFSPGEQQAIAQGQGS